MGLQIGAVSEIAKQGKRIKIGAGITKRGKDYKSVQDTCTRSSETA